MSAFYTSVFGRIPLKPGGKRARVSPIKLRKVAESSGNVQKEEVPSWWV